jgi:hypothetical protein
MNGLAKSVRQTARLTPDMQDMQDVQDVQDVQECAGSRMYARVREKCGKRAPEARRPLGKLLPDW